MKNIPWDALWNRYFCLHLVNTFLKKNQGKTPQQIDYLLN